jgi:hypothetical protein
VRSRAAFLRHRPSASSFGFGNKALDRYFCSGGGFNHGLLMQGKLLFLQFSYSG